MNRAEAIAKCKELDIHRSLSDEEFADLSEQQQQVWVRSRTFTRADNPPDTITAKAENRLALIRKANEAASRHAS